MGNLLATTYNTTGSGSGVVVFLVLALVFYVLVSLGLWGTFIRPGQPGMGRPSCPSTTSSSCSRVAGRPKTWAWFLLMLIIPYIGSLALFVVYDHRGSTTSRRASATAPPSPSDWFPYAVDLLVHPVAGHRAPYRGPQVRRWAGATAPAAIPRRRAATRNRLPPGLSATARAVIHPRHAGAGAASPPMPAVSRHRPAPHLPPPPAGHAYPPPPPPPVAAGQRLRALSQPSAHHTGRRTRAAGAVGRASRGWPRPAPGPTRVQLDRHPGAGAPGRVQQVDVQGVVGGGVDG